MTVEGYAFENYYDWMNASVLINQGTADYWCQVEWQEAVVEDLLKKGKMAELRIWSGDDHNLSRNWEKVVEQDICFGKGGGSRKFAIIRDNEGVFLSVT